jgi:hypothetical protein
MSVLLETEWSRTLDDWCRLTQEPLLLVDDETSR